jgi:hypothetical protein
MLQEGIEADLGSVGFKSLVYRYTASDTVVKWLEIFYPSLYQNVCAV